MRAAGLLLRTAGLLLLLVVLPARGQEWITRWADDGDCIVDEDAEAEGGGLRQLDVLCVDDDVVVADEECDAAAKPDDTWECLATTVVVDSVEGNDLNDGTAENPLKTLRACITRFGEDHSATRKRRAAGCANSTCFVWTTTSSSPTTRATPPRNRTAPGNV